MSFEALGNLGDYVGGIAVILSLAYLALQIRQNTRMLRASPLASSRSDSKTSRRSARTSTVSS